MTHDVYVFGDSHWRVFFPFVNHGAATDHVSHAQDGIRTIDTIANELSGATMWGLLKDESRIGARKRILGTIDSLGGVDNVGLVFGEVDARFHNGRYFVGDRISEGRVYELVARYCRFIQEDLQMSGRVRNKVFIYHGFSYPKMGETLLQPSQPMGQEAYLRAMLVNQRVGAALCSMKPENSHLILNSNPAVSSDGVHLIPEETYPQVLARMYDVLKPFDRTNWEKRQLPL
jgi:hypothetical protein